MRRAWRNTPLRASESPQTPGGNQVLPGHCEGPGAAVLAFHKFIEDYS